MADLPEQPAVFISNTRPILAKFAIIDQLPNKPPQDSVVLMVDEKGPLVAKTYGGRKWCSERARIPSIQPKEGKSWLFGAYNPHQEEVMMLGRERCTGQGFIEFAHLIRENPFFTS